MTTHYKLTDQNMQTRDGYQWVLGEWRETDGTGGLCGPGWLHCYESALLAILRNPADANIDNPRLFECECEGAEKISALKRGYTRMRLIRELPCPRITMRQRVKFAILCAVEAGVQDVDWLAWATHYWSGDDESNAAAASASSAADMAAWAAWAADRAAWAARAADRADRAASAADMASWAAWAAARAASAADRAARAADSIPFALLASLAIEE